MRVSVVATIYLLSFVFGHSAGKCEEERLPKMLFNIFRHGARSPVQLISGDPNNEKWLKIGIGELTNIGKQEQLFNGQITRKRYNQFLGRSYNSSQFYIQSSELNRCVMSGQAFTTGLFPPRQSQIWQNGCLGHSWQPIPVFTTNIANNDFFGKKVFAILSRGGNSNIYDRHKVTIDAISEATGTSIIKDLTSMFLYIDSLLCEIYNNFTLPFGLSAYKDDFYSVIDDIMNLIISDLNPMIAAVILDDIVERIQSFNNGTSAVKTSVYSLSDLHVASMMAALNGTVGEPPFASAIYLELYEPDETVNTDYFMLWYRPKLLAKPRLFYIKNCGYKCPFPQFINLVNQIKARNHNSL